MTRNDPPTPFDLRSEAPYDEANLTITDSVRELIYGADSLLEAQTAESSPAPPVNPPPPPEDPSVHIASNPLRRRRMSLRKPFEKKEPEPRPPSPPVVELKPAQSRTNRSEMQKRMRERREQAIRDRLDAAESDLTLNGVNPLMLEVDDRLLKKFGSRHPRASAAPPKPLKPYTSHRYYERLKKALARRKSPPPAVSSNKTLAEVMNPGSKGSVYKSATPAATAVTAASLAATQKAKAPKSPASRKLLVRVEAETSVRNQRKVATLVENNDMRMTSRSLEYYTTHMQDGVLRKDRLLGIFDENLLRLNSPVQDLLIPPNDPDVVIGKPFIEKNS